jgi:ketosteroid isomerase-like protein
MWSPRHRLPPVGNGHASFDFSAYASSVERKDVPAWSGFFAEDAEWYEYRERNPPRSPNVMRGLGEIRSFLESVAASPVELRISHEVVGPSRVAYRLTVCFEDGRRIIEHIIIELAGGRITSEVDVEAWD